MIELKMIAYFDTTPAEESKILIKNTLSAYILDIDPDAKLEYAFSEGSWVITILTWVGGKFLDWLTNKGFDYLAGRFERKSLGQIEETKNDTSNIVIGGVSEPDNNEGSLNKTSSVGMATSLMSTIEDLQRISRSETVRITFATSKFDPLGEGFGHISTVTKSGNVCDFTVVETFGQEEFRRSLIDILTQKSKI